jgi:outer membrane receptor protein involved in Fe transport
MGKSNMSAVPLSSVSISALAAVIGATTPVQAQQVAPPVGAAVEASAVALAAEPPLAPQEEPSTASGDIIVTALRRNGTVQSIPVSIAALGGDTLQKTGATQLNDIFRQIPNMNVTAGQGGANRITIRGINAAGEAVVGVYYDETPVTGPAGTTQDSGAYAADVNLFDVERVEVLRGPQGTLYGASSMAGTMRIIFNKPDATKFDYAAETQTTTTKGGSLGYFAKGMLNAPIVADKLAARVVGFYEKRPGWIDNSYYGRNNVNDQGSWGVRGLLGFTPDVDTTITASVLYQHSKADDMQGWFPQAGRYKTDSQVRLPFETDTQLYNITGDHDFGFAKLTATASYYKYGFNRAADFTPTARGNASSPTFCRAYYGTASCDATQLAGWRDYALAQLPVLAYQPANVRAQDYEMRLASGAEMPDWLQWTVGTFFEKRDDHILSQNVRADPQTGQYLDPLVVVQSRFVGTKSQQAAQFAELSLKPVEKLTLTAGVRHYDYKKTTRGQLTVGSFLFNTRPGPFTSAQTDASGWLTKFNVSYRVTPRAMIYASAAQGYRPGGANNVPGLPTNLVVYKADGLWNYEAGFKTGWFDNRLTFNAAMYQIDWSDIQTAARTLDSRYSFITNAGTARIRGGEIELSATPVRGLHLGGGIGYADARLTQDQANDAVLITGTTGRDGDRIPNSPKWSGTASADYSWSLSDTLNGLVRADYAYTGRMQSTFRPTDPAFNGYGDFSTVNLRLGLEKEHWGLYLFCQNLGNTVGNTSVSTGGGLTALTYGIMPRTIGINLRLGR